MAEFLGRIFASIFGSHSILATVIIAMFPIVELKGAIPVGMNVDFWGENALGSMQAFLFALLGSCLVVPILALLFTPIINWLKKTKVFRKLGEFIDGKVKKHSTNIVEKMENIDSEEDEKKKTRKKLWIKFLSVFAFVAVPLPLTGVWTGTCVAVAIGLNFWQTVLSVVLGNMVAGLIITTICAIFPQLTTILFLIVLVFVIGIVLYGIVKMLLSKKKDNVDVISEDKNENN